MADWTRGGAGVALGLAAATIATAAARAEALDPGRAIAERFLAADTAAIWSEMTPGMRAALGSEAALAAVRADVGREFGAEAELLAEETRAEGPHATYTRTARWTGAETPLRIVVALDAEGKVGGFWIGPAPVAAESPHLGHATRAALRLPFEGAWHVHWGGRDIADNYHATVPAQRFATDFLVLRDGRSHAGDPAALASYHCWDRPILAPGDGRVVAAVDGLPDQAIGASDPGNPAGNHVILDFGTGEYGLLAHLRAGSVTVAEGDRVAAGAEIGRRGNSGNTTEPHLHFHLQSSPVLGEGLGMPAQFRDYRADGAPVERGEPRRGETVAPAG